MKAIFCVTGTFIAIGKFRVTGNSHVSDKFICER